MYNLRSTASRQATEMEPHTGEIRMEPFCTTKDVDLWLDIRRFVLGKKPKSLHDTVKYARTTQAIANCDSSPIAAIQEQLSALELKMDRHHALVNSDATSLEPRQGSQPWTAYPRLPRNEDSRASSLQTRLQCVLCIVIITMPLQESENITKPLVCSYLYISLCATLFFNFSTPAFFFFSKTELTIMDANGSPLHQLIQTLTLCFKTFVVTFY